jgi:hypothetical protein
MEFREERCNENCLTSSLVTSKIDTKV